MGAKDNVLQAMGYKKPPSEGTMHEREERLFGRTDPATILEELTGTVWEKGFTDYLARANPNKVQEFYQRIEMGEEPESLSYKLFPDYDD